MNNTMDERSTDDKSFKTLEILEELSSNGHVTQRELSRKVGIALGLANFYIKRLVQKGYVEVVYLERNRLGYLITPKGITEKSRLTYHYIQRSYQYVRKIRISIRERLLELSREGVGPVSVLPQLSYDRIIVTEPLELHDVKNLFQEYGIEDEKLVHME